MSEATDYQAGGAPVSSSDPDAIRNEIESTRSNLSSDVNALADRVSPGNVARRQVDKVRDGVGSLKDTMMGATPDPAAAKQAAASAPGQVRAQTQGNPLAAGVIAFGIGMLVSSLLPTSQAEQQAALKVKENAGPLTDAVKDAAAQTAQHLKEPAMAAADSVKQAATDAAATVQDEGRSAAGDVKDQAQDAKDTVQEARSS